MLLLVESPARQRQHQPARSQPRQKRRALQRTPAPAKTGGDALHPEHAEKAVHPEVGGAEVVRAREARQHFAAEPLRAQDHAALDDRDQQIRHRDLPLSRRLRAADVWDLMVAQHRPQDHVAQPSLRQVHDLGEDGVGPQRLLGAQVLLDLRLQGRIPVAEAAEQVGSGGAGAALEMDAEPAPGKLFLRGGCHRRVHREGIRQRRRPGDFELGNIALVQLDRGLPPPRCLLDPAEQERLAWPPGRWCGLLREFESLEQRRGFGRGLARGAKTDAVLLVESLGQRHLSALVAPCEGFAEAAQVVVFPHRRDAAQQLDASRQLCDDASAEHGLGRRLDHVDLEQPGQLDLERQAVEQPGGLAIALRG